MTGLVGNKITKLEAIVGALSGGGGTLPSISDGNLIANVSGRAAFPNGVALSALLDHVLGSTAGTLLYRGASGWTSLVSPTTGQILTGNASSLPIWTTPNFLGSHAVAALPAAPAIGSQAYATDALKTGELTGAGSGAPVYFSSGSWRIFSTDAPVRT